MQKSNLIFICIVLFPLQEREWKLWVKTVYLYVCLHMQMSHPHRIKCYGRRIVFLSFKRKMEMDVCGEVKVKAWPEGLRFFVKAQRNPLPFSVIAVNARTVQTERSMHESSASNDLRVGSTQDPDSDLQCSAFSDVHCQLGLLSCFKIKNITRFENTK